jgi:hypothetical protein
LMMPVVDGFSDRAKVASNSASGTAASFCQRDDWPLLIPRSESDGVARGDCVVPRLVPGSAAPFAFSISRNSSPHRRSARMRISIARNSFSKLRAWRE